MPVSIYETIEVSNPPTPQQLYKLGWNAYCNGDAYASLQTEDERRGYVAASCRQAKSVSVHSDKHMRW